MPGSVSSQRAGFPRPLFVRRKSRVGSPEFFSRALRVCLSSLSQSHFSLPRTRTSLCLTCSSLCLNCLPLGQVSFLDGLSHLVRMLQPCSYSSLYSGVGFWLTAEEPCVSFTKLRVSFHRVCRRALGFPVSSGRVPWKLTTLNPCYPSWSLLMLGFWCWPVL